MSQTSQASQMKQPRPLGQLSRVARIQLVNAPTVLGLPVLVLVLVLLANVVIFGTIGTIEVDSEPVTGAILSLYFTMLVIHLQTMTQVFPFAVSLSVTRRAFFGATVLVVLGQSLAYGVLLYVLKLVEQGTGGWGVNLTFVSLPFVNQDNAVLQIVVYTVPMLLLSFLGIWFGIVFKRWGQLGAWALAIAHGGLGVAFVVVVTWQEWWSDLGVFFAGQSPLALQAGYPLVFAVMFGVAGYLTARRAVP